MLYFSIFIAGIVVAAGLALLPFFLGLVLGEAALNFLNFGRAARYLLIMLKSLRRNLLRTSLTYLAIFVLVMVVMLIWSVLYFMNDLMTEKTKDLKVVITEKWQEPSQMPPAYARPLSEAAAVPNRPGDVRPQDSMTWQFYLGTLDPAKDTRDDLVFLIALEPRKVVTMMDDLFDSFTPDQGRGRLQPGQIAELNTLVAEMEQNKRAVIMGRDRLKTINKRVGDRFTVTGINFRGIDLEFEIVGMFPEGRYNDNAVMNRDYLDQALNAYPKTHGGQKHPLADRSLHIVWLRVRDQAEFGHVAGQISASSLFRDPAVKCQTLSSGLSSWLDVYRDLIWGMRWLLSPAILITIALVISNAISIGVRERRAEMAVLKVLGFRPGQILAIVLGEGMLVGTVSGLLSAVLSWLLVNQALLRFDPTMPLYIPTNGLWWGPAIGAFAALLGSFVPAWSATTVNVSDVFSKVA